MKFTPKIMPISKNQSGLASIIVTMIIMIVISLIVLATAQLARREQRQALDRQLNTQAYYAAESGVNDAVKALQDDNSLLTGEFTSGCSDFISDPRANLTASSVLDSGSNIRYSCLFVDPTPPTWEGNINDTSRTIPIQDKNGDRIAYVEIGWQDKGGSDNFGGCPTTVADLKPLADWNATGCNTPMIRFDLVPTDSLKRDDLNSNTMTGFLFPSGDSSSVSSLSYSNTAAIKSLIKCDANASPKYCKATISVPLRNSYYLRIKSIYGNSSVVVSGLNSSSERVELMNAQAVIDSTGIANDVLRRIQVRIPLSGATGLPEFAIQTGDNICKLLQVDTVANTATSQNIGECPLD